MSVFTVIKKKEHQLTGLKLTEAGVHHLKENLPTELVPSWLISLLQQYSVIGVCFSLDEELDESELGVDLKWLTPEQIIEEALYAYPGKAVTELGYLPIGACLSGSGDPYFLKVKGTVVEDAALVRIPHDAILDDVYPENEIEIVQASLSQFFEQSQVE